jgi:hypothetical protein
MFSLLYLNVDGWDHDTNEPVSGGRYVEGHVRLGDAMQAFADYLLAARRMWGPGHLAIIGPGPEHRLIQSQEISFDPRVAELASGSNGDHQRAGAWRPRAPR